MLKAAIIDSDKASRDLLCGYLDKYFKDIVVVTQAEDVKSARAGINEYCLQLVFLSTELNGENGFDVLSGVGNSAFKTIIVSGCEQLAIKAFDYDVSGYLLKPVDPGLFVNAVNKARDALLAHNSHDIIKDKQNQINSNNKGDATISIYSQNGFEVLKLKNIVKLQAEGSCTRFFMSNGAIKISSRNLGYYNFLLQFDYFIKVNRSEFINPRHLLRYEHFERVIHLTRQITATLSEHYSKYFKNYFRIEPDKRNGTNG